MPENQTEDRSTALLEKANKYRETSRHLDPIANPADRLLLRAVQYRRQQGIDAEAKQAKIDQFETEHPGALDLAEVPFQDTAQPGDKNFPEQPAADATQVIDRPENVERIEAEQANAEFFDKLGDIPQRPSPINLISTPSDRDLGLQSEQELEKREPFLDPGSISQLPATARDVVSDVLDEHTPPVIKLAYNRSITGMAHELAFGNQAFDLSDFEPGVIGEIGANVLSFMMPLDVLTLGAGGRAGQLAVREAVDVFGPKLVRKYIANGVSEKVAVESVQKSAELLLRTGSSATGLGTYDATGAFVEGKDLGEIAKAGVHGGTLGAILGFSGFLARNRSIGEQLGTEVGALTVGSAGLEGRLPNEDDLINSASMIAGLKLTHLITGTVKREAQISGRIKEWLLGETIKGKDIGEATEEMLDMSRQEFADVVGAEPKPKDKGPTEVPVDKVDPVTKEPVEPVKAEVKEPSTLTRNQFNKGHFQHTDIRNTGVEAEKISESIKAEGFKTDNVSFGNTIPPTQGEPTNVVDAKFGTKKGKLVYSFSKNDVDKKTGNIKPGSKPTGVVKIRYDNQPLHEAFIEQALAEGKDVPPEVLKDYPDLAPKATKPDKPVTLEPEKQQKIKGEPISIEEITEAVKRGKQPSGGLMIAETPAEAVKEIIEGKQESKIGTKDFKKQMTAELDKAIAKAPKEVDAEKIDGEFQTITIHIPGDGDFKLDNTKETLAEVKKKVKRIPLTIPQPKIASEHRAFPVPPLKKGAVPHEATHRIETKGEESIPVPASPRSAGPPKRVEVTGKGKYTTDGVYILSNKFIKGDLVVDPDRNKQTAKTVDEFTKDNFDKTVVPSEEVGRLRADPIKSLPDRAVFRSSDGENIRLFDAKYIDWFHKTVPDFSLRIDPKTVPTPAIIMSGKKKVGLLMPVKGGDVDFEVVKNEPVKKKKTPIGDIVKQVKPLSGGEKHDLFKRSVSYIRTQHFEGTITKNDAISALQEKERQIKSKPGSRNPEGEFYLFVPKVRKKVDEIDEAIQRVLTHEREKTKNAPSGIEGSPGRNRQPKLPKKSASDKPTKGTTRSDVINHFRKAFDIPIRTGRFKQKAVGIFKIHEQVVRSREANDLSTISHEVGHFLEHTTLGGGGNKSALRNAPPAVKKELTAMGKALYGSRKPNSGYRSEGFAEFISFWTVTDDVSRMAPETTKYFNEVYLKNNPDIATKLLEGQRLARSWREQGAVNRVYSNIDMSGKKKSSNIRERFSDAVLRANTLFADDLAPLEFVEKKLRGVSKLDPNKITPANSPTMIARSVAQASTGKARMMAIHGTFDFAGQRTGEGLREILEPVNKDVASAVTYSYAKRALELHDRGINPGITREDARQTVSELETPERIKAHEGLTAFENRVMEYLIDSGGMSRESAEVIMQLNPSHIPLKRAIDQGSFTGGGGKKLTGVFSPIKRIKGSGLEIKNPYASIIENTSAIISFADKVRVGRELVNLATSTKGGGKWVEKIPAPQQATKISLEKIKDQLIKAGVDISEADMSQVLTAYSNAGLYNGRDNIVSFWRDGKQEFYQVDPTLYKTLKAVDDITVPPVIDFIFGRPARAIRLGATGLNAGFGLITNPLRDAFTFGLQSEFGSSAPHKTVYRLGKGLVNRLDPNNKMNMLYKRSGADFSQFLGMDRDQLLKAVDEVMASTAKQKALNVVSHPIELFKDLFSITESAPRLAEFEAAYKAGEKKYGKNSTSAQIMANLAASEVTVNFRRAGVYGRYINQIIPFWNAQVQGVSRFARFAKENPEKAAIKAIATLTIPTIGIWLQNKDEDWYKDMKPWQRYGFWNIETGTNEDGSPRIMRIPRPFEWGVVFSALPEMTLDYMYSKDKSVINDGLKYMIQQTIPVGPGHIPTTLKVPIEAWANYDFFRDRPIDPYFEAKYKEPEDRFSPYTSETAKFLGKQMGVSPRKIDFLASSLTGGLARDAIRVGESIAGVKEDTRTGPASLPVVGRLFQHTQTPEKRQERIGFAKSEKLTKLRTIYKAGKKQQAKEDTEAWNRKHPDNQISFDRVVNLVGQRRTIMTDMVDQYLETGKYPQSFEEDRKKWNQENPKLKISQADIRKSKRRREKAKKKKSDSREKK